LADQSATVKITDTDLKICLIIGESLHLSADIANSKTFLLMVYAYSTAHAHIHHLSGGLHVPWGARMN